MKPVGPPGLNEQYLEALRRYDRGAVRRKRLYVLVWMTITVTTWLTLLSGTPLGNRPVNVPPAIDVGEPRMKSSADSISLMPGPFGREAVAMRLSGLPVLKKKGPADAVLTRKNTADAAATTEGKRILMLLSARPGLAIP